MAKSQSLFNPFIVAHDTEEKDEVMSVHFTYGLPEVVLDYLDGDIDITPPSDEKTKCLTPSYESVKLFGRNAIEVVVSGAGKRILSGEEKDVEDALAIIKKNPDLLRYQAIAIDPQGRYVKGTLLQIAVMAGEINLKRIIVDEKNHGIVERLIAAGNLSEKEVAEQLQVITSKEAQQENEKRNQLILVAIEKFGKGIYQAKINKNMSFEAFQSLCEPLITQLEEDLQAATKGVITSGYIFDPALLHEVANWYKTNIKHFGGWWNIKSDVFWVNGFGKIQSKLSSRDAQTIRNGTSELVDDHHIPPRTLENPDKGPRLGLDFYVTHDGVKECNAVYAGGTWSAKQRPNVWKEYAEQKAAIMQELCDAYEVAWANRNLTITHKF